MGLQLAACPSCGAAIKLAQGQGVAQCVHCGKSLLAPSTAASGPAAANLMRLADAALEADNPDEAYGFYTRVLETEPDSHEAWFGKAEAAGAMTTIRNPRTVEVEAAVRQAIKAAPAAVGEMVARRGADIVSRHGRAYFRLCRSHFRDFASADDAWPDFVEQALDAVGILQRAQKLESDPETLIAMIEVCQAVLGGQEYYAEFDENPRMRWYRPGPQTIAHFQPILDQSVAEMARLDPAYAPPVLTKPPTGLSTQAKAILIGLAVLFVLGFFACAR